MPRTHLRAPLMADPTFAAVHKRVTTTFAVGQEALQKIGKERAFLLYTLEKETGAPVDLTVDRTTGAVTHMKLRYPARSEQSNDLASRRFLERFSNLLDPNIGPDEYVRDMEEAPCGQAAVAFAREIAGTRVLGGKAVFHYSPEGFLISIESSIPSVSARIVPYEGSAKLPPGARAALTPVDDDGNRYLQQSYVFPSGAESGRYSYTVELGTATFGPLNGGVTTPAPSGDPVFHINDVTGLPYSISYRAVGGKTAEMMPIESNPAEAVYRFLTAERNLFRTGAPRCQFRQLSVAETPQLPGVHTVRLQQVYAGVPVFGGELVFEVHDGTTVMSVNGKVLNAPSVPVQPLIGADEAASVARSSLRTGLLRDYPDPVASEGLGAMISSAPTVNLVVFPGELLRYEKLPTALAWKVEIGPYTYIVHAQQGTELYAWSKHPQERFRVFDAGGRSEFLKPFFDLLNVDGTTFPLPPGRMPDPLTGPFGGLIDTYRSSLAALGWPGQGTGKDVGEIVTLVLMCVGQPTTCRCTAGS